MFDFKLVDKCDNRLFNHNIVAMHALSVLKDGNCFGDGDAVFAYIGPMLEMDNCLLIDRIDVDSSEWERVPEQKIISYIKEFAIANNYQKLKLRCDYYEESAEAEEIQTSRNKDAAIFLGFDKKEKPREFVEYSLLELLQGTLVEGYLDKSEAFCEVIEPLDDDYSFFCYNEEGPIGSLKYEIRTDGIIHINKPAFMDVNNREKIYLSMLVNVLFKLTEVFFPDTRVRIELDDAGIINRTMLILGENPRLLKEEYLELDF